MWGMKKYAKIPVPALAIFGSPHGLGKWVDNSTDPKICEAAKAYSAALTALTESQAKAFENGVPTARVVRIHGAHHYVYLSNEADVLREMNPSSPHLGSSARSNAVTRTGICPVV
jgi:non-heme chloroperoxidase